MRTTKTDLRVTYLVLWLPDILNPVGIVTVEKGAFGNLRRVEFLEIPTPDIPPLSKGAGISSRSSHVINPVRSQRLLALIEGTVAEGLEYIREDLPNTAQNEWLFAIN